MRASHDSSRPSTAKAMSSASKSRALERLARLIPSSLSARLLLVTFGSILAAQLVSGLVYLHDRREISSRFSAFDWSERVDNIAELLAPLPSAQRPPQARRFLGARAIADVPQDVHRIRRYDNGDLEFMRLFQERVASLPHQGYEITISPADFNQHADIVVGTFNDLPAVGTPAYMDVHLAFAAGAPLMLRLQQVERSVGVPNHFYVYPLALIGSLCLGALLLSRGITGPLSRLAAAADALGRGQAHEAIPEVGARELRRAAHAFNSMQ